WIRLRGKNIHAQPASSALHISDMDAYSNLRFEKVSETAIATAYGMTKPFVCLEKPMSWQTPKTLPHARRRPSRMATQLENCRLIFLRSTTPTTRSERTKLSEGTGNSMRERFDRSHAISSAFKFCSKAMVSLPNTNLSRRNRRLFSTTAFARFPDHG